MINVFYINEDSVIQDYELQNWAKALVAEAQINGIPGNGVIKSKADLIYIFSLIMFNGSAEHAAVNFGQYDFAGYIPNIPGGMNLPPPQTKAPIKESQIMKVLPGVSATISQISLTYTLSQNDTNNLGNFEEDMFFDNTTSKLVNDFKKALSNAQVTITKRNAVRQQPYPYLVPNAIPNSIPI